MLFIKGKSEAFRPSEAAIYILNNIAGEPTAPDSKGGIINLAILRADSSLLPPIELEKQNQSLLNDLTQSEEKIAELAQAKNALELLLEAEKSKANNEGGATPHEVEMYRYKIEHLKQELHEAKLKAEAAGIKANQAVVTFSLENMKAIGALRKLLVQLGVDFTSDEPEEVIHAAINGYLSHLQAMKLLVQPYKNLLEVN